MFSFKGLIENAEKSGDLPKSGEPLNCAFQRRTSKAIWCGLTRSGSGGGLRSLDFASNYEPCLIDICPLYQSLKLLKER